MQKVRQHNRIQAILDILPQELSREIIRLGEGRASGLSGIREIRLRRGGLCSMTLENESIRLFSSLSDEESEELVSRLCRGAVYAHRDSIAYGYVSLDGGIRVGVCGKASYDGGRLIGISDMRSLVFRIPSGECAFADELYRTYLSGVGSGMLIYSPPGVGKTTALRALAKKLGSGKNRICVCVVDERCEFSEEDYEGCEVDILKGYKRDVGIEIATRTMSPDVIMIDEIGADDAEAILGAVRCGIPLVATAHASSAAEVMSKPSLKPLLACSAFELLVGISHADQGYSLRADRL